MQNDHWDDDEDRAIPALAVISGVLTIVALLAAWKAVELILWAVS